MPCLMLSDLAYVLKPSLNFLNPSAPPRTKYRVAGSHSRPRFGRNHIRFASVSFLVRSFRLADRRKWQQNGFRVRTGPLSIDPKRYTTLVPDNTKGGPLATTTITTTLWSRGRHYCVLYERHRRQFDELPLPISPHRSEATGEERGSILRQESQSSGCFS